MAIHIQPLWGCGWIVRFYIVELKSGDKDDFHRKVRAGMALADYLIGMLENYKKRTMKKFSFQYRGLLFYTGVGKEHSDPNFEYDIHPELKYKYTAKPCKGKPLKIFLK